MDMFTGDDAPAADQEPERICLFLGNAPLLGLTRNFFGDSNSLFRADAIRALGGFREDYGVGHTDWEIMARAALQGLHLETVPEQLFWYRSAPGTITSYTDRYTNFMHSLRPYIERMPPELVDLPQYAQGLYLRNIRCEQTIQQLNAELEAVRNSRSWKLTAPGRNIWRSLKGAGQKQDGT
jgi:hypothetical protein